jgi:hypothetical protein
MEWSMSKHRSRRSAGDKFGKTFGQAMAGLGAVAMMGLLSACAFGVKTDGSDLDEGESIGGEAREIPAFAEIDLIGPDSVQFTHGERYSIRAEGPEATLSKLRMVQKGERLVIGRSKEGWNWSDAAAATIIVSGPGLARAKIAGSGDFVIDQLDGAVDLVIAGSGTMRVAAVAANSLSAKIVGSGDLVLAGKAPSAKIRIAGSGDVDAKGLTVDDADLTIAGSGNITLTSDGRVKARSVGSGNIRIYGSAACDAKESGSGEIVCE